VTNGAGAGKRPKVLVAVPHLGQVDFEWTKAILEMFCATRSCDIFLHGVRRKPVAMARNMLVSIAQQAGCSHILFVDSDTIPPKNAVKQLLSHNLPVVSGVTCVKSNGPSGPNVFLLRNLGGRATEVTARELAKKPLYTHEDVMVGASCLLVDLSVFEKLPKPWFNTKIEQVGPETREISEDIWFCHLLQDAKIPIHIDTTIRCLHVHDFLALDWDGGIKVLPLGWEHLVGRGALMNRRR
jgi:hypothetical protein